MFIKCATLISLIIGAWLGAKMGRGPLPHAPPGLNQNSASRPETTASTVAILAIDGVRWQEVMLGVDERLGSDLGTTFTSGRGHSARELMPNLHALAEKRGTLFGSNSAPMHMSSASTVSLPGYIEIFSGRSTTCTNNDCPATTSPTLLDEWADRYASSTLGVLASWPNIARAAAQELSRATVSVGRSVQVNTDALCDDAPLCELYRSGLRLSAAPGVGGYRPDRATAALALRYMHTKQPDFLFVGLGDTDEYAHGGDYGGYLRALHAADETLGAISAWLETREQQGARTLLICTSDHGRSNDFKNHGGAPEAARVWALFAGSVVKARGHMVAAPSRLADIAPTVREFVGLPNDTQAGSGRSLLPLLTRSAAGHEQAARASL